ncbi:hypothetical protein RUND412_010824 [Rhizina undulata]
MSSTSSLISVDSYLTTQPACNISRQPFQSKPRKCGQEFDSRPVVTDDAGNKAYSGLFRGHKLRRKRNSGPVWKRRSRVEEHENEGSHDPKILRRSARLNAERDAKRAIEERVLRLSKRVADKLAW